MTPTELAETLWLYAVLPLLAAGFLWFTVRLSAPQWTQLGKGFRSLSAEDKTSELGSAPGSATWTAAALSLGPFALIGAATAVSLGGASVLAWIWLLALVVTPLRYAEVVLSRTNPVGKSADASPRSLAGHFIRSGGNKGRFGWALMALFFVTAVLVCAGPQGDALFQVAAELPSARAASIAGSAGLCAAALGAWSVKAGARILGWVSGLSFAAALVVGLALVGSDVGRAMSALSWAVSESFSGAPLVGAFSGATLTEVISAVVLFGIPALLLPTGAVGAVHADARASSTKAQAAGALVPPLLFATVTSLMVMGYLAVGAFSDRVDSTRALSEVRFYTNQFESASQREESERTRTGPVRIVDGTVRDSPMLVATDRGVIRSPQFLDMGASADIAVNAENGFPVQLMRKVEGNLGVQPASEMKKVTVRGQMLPRGAALHRASVEQSFGEGAALASLLVLLLLGIAAGAGWGFAVGKAASPFVSAPVSWVLGAVPGLALTIIPLTHGATVPGFVGPLYLGALIVGGVFVFLSCGALLSRSAQVKQATRTAASGTKTKASKKK